MFSIKRLPLLVVRILFLVLLINGIELARNVVHLMFSKGFSYRLMSNPFASNVSSGGHKQGDLHDPFIRSVSRVAYQSYSKNIQSQPSDKKKVLPVDFLSPPKPPISGKALWFHNHNDDECYFHSFHSWFHNQIVWKTGSIPIENIASNNGTVGINFRTRVVSSCRTFGSCNICSHRFEKVNFSNLMKGKSINELPQLQF